MIDPEEYEHARQLLSEALNKAYEGVYLVPPMELAPGYWVVWPHRDVRLNLEETQIWHYGVPKGGTGNLQAHIMWPYIQHKRVKPLPIGSRFDEDTALRAVEAVKEISDSRAKHYRLDNPSAQKAYIAAYQMVEAAPQEEVKNLWRVWRETLESRAGNWDALHRAIRAFLRMGLVKKGVLDWMPSDFAEDPRWESFNDLGAERLYDTTMRGVMDALEDWAVSEGFYEVKRD